MPVILYFVPFQIICSIIFGYLSKYSTRISDRNHIRWNILCDNTARSDNSIISDVNPAQNLHISAKPYISTNMNGCRNTSSLNPFLRVDRMVRRIDTEIGAD